MSRWIVSLCSGLATLAALAIWARPVGDPSQSEAFDPLGCGVDRLLMTFGPPLSIEILGDSRSRWVWPRDGGGTSAVEVGALEVTKIESTFDVATITRSTLPPLGPYLGQTAAAAGLVLGAASTSAAPVVVAHDGKSVTIWNGRIVRIEPAVTPVADRSTR